MATRSARAERAAVDPALPFKRRARRRLVGAVMVALTVAIGLPFVLDPEPTFERPDLRVEIPSRDQPLPQASHPSPPIASQSSGVTASGQDPARAAPVASGQSPAAASPSVVAPVAAPPVSAAQPSGRSPVAAPVAPGPSKSTQARSNGSTPPPATQAPAQAKPPRTPVAAAPSASNRWLVQAGLFARAENATALVSRIKALGLPAYTESVDGGQGVRLRVRIGPFATRGDADQARARLSLNGIDATLVSQ